MERLEHSFIPDHQTELDRLEHSWEPEPGVGPQSAVSESLRAVVGKLPSRLEHSWSPATGPITMRANLVPPTTSVDGLSTPWVWPPKPAYNFPRRLEHEFRWTKIILTFAVQRSPQRPCSSCSRTRSLFSTSRPLLTWARTVSFSAWFSSASPYQQTLLPSS